MNRFLAIVALVVGTSGIARADSLDERFDRATAALVAHRPEDAARELRRIVALGVEDPDVYRNLGIAEAESMHYGLAMVAFERSLSLRPSDPVSRRGLENATTMLARRATERRGSPAEIAEAGALESFARSIPEPIAAYGTLAAVWLLCLSAIAARVTSRESARIAAITLVVVSALATLGFGTAILGRARWGGTIAPAIVVRDRTPIVSAPDVRAPTVSTLDERERVTLVERHGAFARVEVDGRSRGWVARSAIGTY